MNITTTTAAWKVTKHYQLTTAHGPRLIFHLEGPEHLCGVKVTFDGHARRYEWDRWELLLDAQYRTAIDDALREFLLARSLEEAAKN
jgi:hypothetical protein